MCSLMQNDMPLGCEYSLSKDCDDNANSFDAIAFLLCALCTIDWHYFHCQSYSHGSRWNVLAALTSATTDNDTERKKKRTQNRWIENVHLHRISFVRMDFLRAWAREWERFELSLVSIMKCMDFYRYRAIFDYILLAIFLCIACERWW